MNHKKRKYSNPIRVGIVGLGKMGLLRARCVREHPNMILKAICDANPDLGQTLEEVPFYREYEELLRQNLDVIFVCVYNNVAPRFVMMALEHGCHVFCEKPPGRSVEDVERIIAVERSHPNLKLKFGFNHRCHYAVMEAKEMLDSARFGEILWMRGVYGKCGGIQFENSWRNQEDVAGGGILLDQGIHMLDLFRYFVGDFDKVQSLTTTSHWKIPFEDNAFVILSNAKKQVALLHSSATQWKHRFSLEICLQHGYININGILSSTRSYGDECITFAKKQFEDETFALGRPREETVYFDRDDSWALEVVEFARCVEKNLPVVSGSSQDALEVMKMIEAIYEGRETLT